MKPLYRKVKIGTLKYIPRKPVKQGYWDSDDIATRKWINEEWSPSSYEWIDTGKIGLLYNFYVETTSDGDSSVVGLIELEDGQFDTFSATCIKAIPETEDE